MMMTMIMMMIAMMMMIKMMMPWLSYCSLPLHLHIWWPGPYPRLPQAPVQSDPGCQKPKQEGWQEEMIWPRPACIMHASCIPTAQPACIVCCRPSLVIVANSRGLVLVWCLPCQTSPSLSPSGDIVTIFLVFLSIFIFRAVCNLTLVCGTVYAKGCSP